MTAIIICVMSQCYGFSSGHVWMWELDCEESWMPKNWCFWTVVYEKTLESPLDSKETQPVHPKGDQSWVFIGKTDVEAETPILWPPNAKSWLTGKDLDAGKDWKQEEKGMTENEMVGWCYQLDGRGFGWTPGVGDGQGGLACCGSWGHKESGTAEWLKWTEDPLHGRYHWSKQVFKCSWHLKTQKVVFSHLLYQVTGTNSKFVLNLLSQIEFRQKREREKRVGPCIKLIFQ